MPIRVLCLHGAQQTKEIFQNQLSRLQDDLADVAELMFIDAPHVLPLITAEDDTPTRSWCSADDEEDYSEGDALVMQAMQPAGPGTQLAFTVMLGFSQGALMIYRYLKLHGCEAATQEQLRGVVVAGAPDPRRVFGPGRKGHTAAALFDGTSTSSTTFFGALPFLHIIGKKDSVVPPEESAAFAQVCSDASRVLYHEHAHSIPALKEVRLAVRGMCVTAAMSSAEAAEAREARESEVEMIRAMYDEDAVVERGGETLVRLSLLPGAESLLASSSSAVACALDSSCVHALERIKLCLHVPLSYPSMLPTAELVDGPAWHSVKFERWAAEMVVKVSAYMAEELGLGSALLLPTYLYASAMAQEQLEELVKVLAEGASGARRSGSDDGDDAVDPAGPWAAENDTSREAFIAEAEAKAARLLMQGTRRSREDHGSAAGAGAAEDEKDVTGKEAAGEAAETGDAGVSSTGGGSCTLTIGLIGKPSAGKSTFFNAVTDPQEEALGARVAAFPFTTIEPNIGAGFAPLFCPCSTFSSSAPNGDAAAGGFSAGAAVPTSQILTSSLSCETCDATYGHVRALGNGCFRRHPVKVKDVAGLVQGAYQGKGKGNQFLNDLCDADVLVHVVDGAAATEADGTACAPGQGSALEDITWVRSEVHSWIYDNLRAKWCSLIRQPSKFRSMFTGYHSTPAFIDKVLRRVGVSNEVALTAKLKTWGPVELHAFVAVYIRMRFPMVVALNKADLSSAEDISAALRQAYPHEIFVPMSARTECLALQLNRKQLIEYTPGAPSVSVTYTGDVSKLDKATRQELDDVTTFFASIQARSTPLLATTGVQDVLATAMEACGVVLVYPVRAFHPVTSLAHCLTFKQGSSAEKVFNSLLHLNLLEGKLVRFEVIDVASAKQRQLQQLVASLPTVSPTEVLATFAASRAGPPMVVRTLRKTEVIPSAAVLARVLSNKRQLA
jgi:ribosome-binding ATPase